MTTALPAAAASATSTLKRLTASLRLRQLMVPQELIPTTVAALALFDNKNQPRVASRRGKLEKETQARYVELLHCYKEPILKSILVLYVLYPVSLLLFFRESEIVSVFRYSTCNRIVAVSFLAATLASARKFGMHWLPVGLLLGMLLLKYDMDEWELWSPSSRSSAVNLAGKVAVVTGANRGLGFATAKLMASLGAHVVMTCRTIAKCEPAVQKVNAAGASVGGSASAAVLNLNSLESAYNLTQQLRQDYPTIHYLINNAGSTPIYDLTVEGLEDGFGGMHLAHVAVTLGLLPSLQNVSASSQSRIVMVASEMAMSSAVGVFGSPPFGDDFMIGAGEGDLRGERTRANGQQVWNDLKVYGRSKLCNVLFARELNRRMERREQVVPVVVAHAIHTGGVYTRTTAREIRLLFPSFVPGLRSFVSHCLLRLFFRSPDQGARAVVGAALSDQPKSLVKGGAYLDAMSRPFLPRDCVDTRDEDTAKATIHVRGGKTITLFEPIYAMYRADRKWGARLWDVSLSLLRESPARAVVANAP